MTRFVRVTDSPAVSPAVSRATSLGVGLVLLAAIHAVGPELAGVCPVGAAEPPGAASAETSNQPVDFNREVRPILSDKCFRCHGPDAGQRKADLRLDDEQEAKAAAIVPGKVDESELVARIVSDDPELRMPPPESGKQLSAPEIELLKRWIGQGAPYARHWSFIPPRRPPLPDVTRDGWVANPLDRFVLARLEREGLQPSPEADRYTLLRRASLDLIGLPPTPEEIRQFVEDRSDNAWEQAVDRLLASRRYGEQMARFWLDAARYADTNGYQYDLEREQWVWRDWVIHAFNQNMPFDQFTVEQIAGDLLPNATEQQKLATAFHRNHPITIEGGVIDEEYRTEYVVDRVVTTSTTWLGLTMICGRCHDHKYDPIQQREFYQFFAFFNQVPERGLQGFDPKLKVESPLQSEGRRQLEQELQTAESQLARLSATAGESLADWEQQLSQQVREQWSVVVPDLRTSQGGADLVVQPDQSILASGKNPATEMYELIFDCDQPVYAVRLEALTDKSHVGGSTGRGSNGNFVLSEFQLAASAKAKGGAKGANEKPERFEPRKIAAADADYEQQGYPVAATIDGKIDRSGWAVDGNTRAANCTAVFTLAEPLRPDTVGRVRIQLHHAWGGSHHIGRFRLAVAGHPLHDVPQPIVTVLDTATAQRTEAQQQQLTEYLAGRFGSAELRQAASNARRLRERRDQMVQVPPTMVMAELPTPRATHVLFRGEYDKPRDPVTAGTPAALPPMPADAPRNRLGLAQWMVMADNPLTSRVAVNRFWQRLFGNGIVKTTEDFGAQGEWPSHPELLDLLAVDFVESGWNIKALLKQIMMSATYRQSSRVTEELRQRDPENRLLARGPRMRLDAEVIRDSALQAAGLLSPQLGGPSVFPYHPAGLWQEINNRPGYSRVYKQDQGDKLYRRSLYTFWKRTVPPPSMAAFDAPEREYCVVRRSRTNTPLQALVLLHDPQFLEASRNLAQRMMIDGGESNADRIRYGFLRCNSRPPTDDERAVLEGILTERLARYQANPQAAEQLVAVGDSPPDPSLDPIQLAAWTTVGRVMMNLSEFVTKP